VLGRAIEVGPELNRRAAEVAQLVAELSGYTEGHAERLLLRSLNVRKAVRVLVDAPLVEQQRREDTAALLAGEVTLTLTECWELGDVLSTAWSDVRATTNRRLPRYLRASRSSQDELKRTVDRSVSRWQ
jgi:hypothetical protein